MALWESKVKPGGAARLEHPSTEPGSFRDGVSWLPGPAGRWLFADTPRDCSALREGSLCLDKDNARGSAALPRLSA